jgi:hypothetical protein
MSQKVGNAPDEYKGEPLDDELANGPMQKRGCTDILCCLLFIAFLGGMVGIASYALSRGNPNLIGRGYDQDKGICGVSNGYTDYPYLYFTVPKKGYLSQVLCVKTCPSSPLPTSLECKTNTKYSNCVGTTNDATTMAALYAAGTDQTGNLWIYNTTAYFTRYCAPNSDALSNFAKDASGNLFNNDILEQWFADVKTAWPVIAVSVAVAFVIGLIYMVLLRYCTGVLTWLAIFGFILGMAILGWRFYQNAVDESGSDASSSTSSTNTQAQKIIAYVCWAICGVTVLAVLCLYSRIKLAIAILKAAADYVKATLSVFFVPPVVVTILVLWYTYWTITSVYLVASAPAVTTGETPITSFAFDSQLKKLMVYNLLGLLWVNAFVLASTQFIIASSTCLWYFSQGTGQKAPGTIRTSTWRLFRYHFGSIAFGSLLLALVQLARIILAYIQAQAKKMQGKENKLVKWGLACLQCYLACFERFIKFLNKNAYIQIALTGKNFCSAAKDGFFLVIRNPLRMGALATIGSIFVFFGKIFIAALTAMAAFIYLTKGSQYTNKLYSPFIPVLLIFCFAYAVGAVFMTIYGLAADAILACFIVDEEIHKKKNAPPLHCPESLKTFLDKHKKN